MERIRLGVKCESATIAVDAFLTQSIHVHWHTLPFNAPPDSHFQRINVYVYNLGNDFNLCTYVMQYMCLKEVADFAINASQCTLFFAYPAFRRQPNQSGLTWGHTSK